MIPLVTHMVTSLDCVAVASLSDVSRNRTNPGIQVTLPLYNPQKDEGCVSYFKYKGIKKVCVSYFKYKGIKKVLSPQQGSDTIIQLL